VYLVKIYKKAPNGEKEVIFGQFKQKKTAILVATVQD
jgi:RecG-like helicase